jgi:sensor domain CHASE-containing protein
MSLVLLILVALGVMLTVAVVLWLTLRRKQEAARGFEVGLTQAGPDRKKNEP